MILVNCSRFVSNEPCASSTATRLEISYTKTKGSKKGVVVAIKNVRNPFFPFFKYLITTLCVGAGIFLSFPFLFLSPQMRREVVEPVDWVNKVFSNDSVH